jgi:crotonobetainyl-CoA:carnitine CoA-transferase CaiB-like acyl-CoA transferase
MKSENSGPFSGIRIIDMTSIVFGPYATQILGDLGADVIKVEAPGGDIFRKVQAARSHGMGAAYMSSNRNKRSIVLDLKRKEARDALLRLIAGADVFVHSVRPQAIERLGLSYEEMKTVRPSLVYCAAVGFGSNGPYSGRPAYDDVIQSVSGIAHLLGRASETGEPAFAPMVMADKTAALTVAYSIMAALFHRERTGAGQEVEVPMFETVVSWNLVEHMNGELFRPAEGSTCYDRLMTRYRRPYATADGHIAILPYTSPNWRAFFAIAGRDDMIDDPRTNDASIRAARIAELYELVAQIMPSKTTAEWLALLQEADIPAAPVNSLEDLFEDEHLSAIGFFIDEEHPSEGTIRTPSPPVRFSQSPSSLRRHAPRLGEHTREVLGEAGLVPEEIESLIASGACRA